MSFVPLLKIDAKRQLRIPALTKTMRFPYILFMKKLIILRKILLLCTLICLSGIMGARGESISRPVVDQRIELLSIVARLAGFSEYQTNINKDYVVDIDKHFSSSKNHPVIQTIQEARTKTGVSYDAVMQMAISLSAPPHLTPILPLNNPGIDRWDSVLAEKFITQLQDFYTKSRADEFFKAQEKRYAQAEQELPKLFQELDSSWYAKYYGRDNAKNFHIVLGLANQNQCYGPTLSHPGQDEQFYAIMGISGSFDEQGKFVQSTPFSYLNLLLHEFNHPFINPIIEKYKKNLQKDGQDFYDEVRDLMPSSYSLWNVVLAESLVRASVVRYMMAHQATEAQIKQEYSIQANQGFLWIPDLVQLLNNYEKNRKVYKNLDAFLPRYQEFLRSWTKRLAACPKIVSVDEIKENGTSISPATRQLTIHFSHPMDTTKGMSIYTGSMGMPHFPPLDIERCRYSADGKILRLQLKPEGLKPNWDYSFVMKGERFISRNGDPLRNKLISFKTLPQ